MKIKNMIKDKDNRLFRRLHQNISWKETYYILQYYNDSTTLNPKKQIQCTVFFCLAVLPTICKILQGTQYNSVIIYIDIRSFIPGPEAASFLLTSALKQDRNLVPHARTESS